MKCDERDCQNEADDRLYCVIGKHFCPHCWLELLPPTNQFDTQRSQDNIARSLIAYT